MKENASTRRVSLSLLTISLVACFWILGPVHAKAVGVAYCFLEHGKANDETISRTTVSYALVAAESRSQALFAAYTMVNATLQEDYKDLIGKSAYQHGEGISSPRCDTWAFSSGYWTLKEVGFEDSLYKYNTIVAGVGSTPDAAKKNATENLRLHNWSWSEESEEPRPQEPPQPSPKELPTGDLGDDPRLLASAKVDPT